MAIRIRKSSVRTTFVIIAVGIVAFIILVGIYATFDANAKWDNDATWQIEDGYKNPTTESNDFKYLRSGDEVTYSTNYCMLYRIAPIIERVYDGPSEYDTTGAIFNCSFMSEISFSARFNSDSEKATIDGKEVVPDISWKINLANDPEPEEYVMPVLSKYTYASRLEKPVPVSINVAYTLKKPEKNISNVANHYVNSLKGIKGTINVEITSWSVKPLSN